jgi:hypothetical protein
MRRRRIEVIRYRRVTVIGGSDSELHSALFAEANLTGERELAKENLTKPPPVKY